MANNKVLIADDDQHIAELIKVYFEKDPAYISQLKHYEEIDLADIKTEMKIYNAQNSYDDNVKNIDRLLSGLGISNIEK